MKRILPLALLCLLIFSVSSGFTEIIRENNIHAKKVIIYLRGHLRLPIVVDDRIVFSEIGGRTIKSLRRLDILVDKEGRLQGVRIIYDDSVSGLKSIYIPHPKTIVFEKPVRETDKNLVRLRVLTSDEIINIW
jgi:hypothetical protein